MAYTQSRIGGEAVTQLEKYQFVLDKIAAGDADYAAGRVVSMDEVEKRTQAVIDTFRATLRGSALPSTSG